MKTKTFCFDLDNTLCDTVNSQYEKSKPKKNEIKIVNYLFDQGHIIKINTARYMGRSNDKLVNKQKLYIKITKQLKKFGIKYHKLFISKPAADIYIDDKAYGYNKSWVKKFRKY
jgi:hypothetical protein|tara:strand:+ start:773 stop:1114 length:342 start_codon:yes stop_codon:yes gene_type:complete